MLMLRVGNFSDDGNASGYSLGKSGIVYERCESGWQSLEFLRTFDFDIALIDLELPDMPGNEAIKLARAAGFDTPSIILSKSASTKLMMTALDQGADDFVIIPYHMDELLARVRAVIRRSKKIPISNLQFGPLEIYPHLYEVWVKGQEISFSRREFGVLQLLLLSQGAILTKQAFLNYLYATNCEPEMKIIDVLVCHVRKKLIAAGLPNMIETVYGYGYKLRKLPPENYPSNVVPFVNPIPVA